MRADESGQSAGLSGAAMAAVGVLFALSGAAALVYQVAWQRILALHTGVGVTSVALITAAFMAGLGLGSHVGGVFSAGVDPARALRLFAAVELGIGVCAAVSCWLYYDVLYLSGSWLYSNASVGALLHFPALVLPTGLMGMSLPFLVRGTVRDAETAGRTVSILYGINVLGASLGALVTPWVLIRGWGIRGAVLAGVCANVAAGLGALGVLLFARHSPAVSAGAATRAPAPRAGWPPLLWVGLYALSGFCALSLEMLWFRLTDLGVKGTAFTFGTVLAVYLLGLASGSLAGVGRRMQQPLRTFLLCQCLLLACAAAAVVLLARLPPDAPGYRWFFEYWSERRGFKLGRAWDPALFLKLYVAWPAALFLVPTVLMGLSFAALQRAVHDDPRTSGLKVGVLQAANIAGCAAGSLVVGLVLLHRLGTTGTLRVLLGCGLLFAAIGLARFGARTFLPLATALAALAVAVPGQEDLWRRLHGLRDASALVEEDATGVIALTTQQGGEWWLWINGRSLSQVPYGGVHTHLGALPAVVHPAPVDAAVIGLGSGDSAWSAACRETIRGVTVFEICSPQERLLKRLLAREGTRSLKRFFGDQRIRLVLEDGRNVLGREDRRYDIIEADALLPEAAYSGNLYSLEFFQLAARRLRPGGVMCTWAPTPRTYATFCLAFPHVLEFRGGILVGSRDPIPLDADAWAERLLAPQVRSHLGPVNTANVLRLLQDARPASCPTAPLRVNRDLDPGDEFASPW